MPFKCCVPNCNGNYKNGPKVATFSFPKDEEMKRKWLHAICRKDFQPTNNTKVCELHFQLSEIERKTSHYVESTGKLLTASLGHPRLIKGAVPSQFPNFPRYMTTNDAPQRLAPETKRIKLENAMIEQTTHIASSIKTEQVFNEKIEFSSLDELYAKLKERIDLQKWIVSRRDNILYILHIEDISYPNIKCCARVSEDFTLRLFYGSREVTKLNDKKFNPFIVSSVFEIEDILHQALISIDKKYQDCSAMENINMCIDILNSLLVTLPQRKPVIKFLLQQIKLLNTSSKGAFRYSWETILFCGLLHSISPHSYNFLRNSGHLLLPSLTTIKRICSKSPVILRWSKKNQRCSSIWRRNLNRFAMKIKR